MDKFLDRIEVCGFKSIRECDIPLKRRNVLIGSNGSGKSNFLSIFSLLYSIIEGDLAYYANVCGSNTLFFDGIKITDKIHIAFYFGDNRYGFDLKPTDGGGLIFSNEFYGYRTTINSLGRGHLESKWKNGVNNGIDRYVKPVMSSHAWRIYHFHDTSRNAGVKQTASISDNISLRDDASNLASFLHMLSIRYPEYYKRIVMAIRSVAPYFDDFVLRPTLANEENIRLEWRSVGNDEPFNAHQLSDGTLRFICLATLLLQPPELQPATIVIDEPELGLHPAAISVVADMMHEVTEPPRNKQIIISTQSVDMLNEFDADDIIVVDREDGESKFRRLAEESLKVWLEEYTLGDLWNKNILGGRP